MSIKSHFSVASVASVLVFSITYGLMRTSEISETEKTSIAVAPSSIAATATTLTPQNTTSTIEAGEPTPVQATKDLESLDCGREQMNYMTFPEVTVLNHSSVVSDYLITVTYTSKSGAWKYDDAFIEINSLATGQSIQQSGTGIYLEGADAICKVTSILRSSST